MSHELEGLHALVTGGSQGIGFGVADALLGAGASVTLVARNEDRLRAAADQLGSGDRKVFVASADTSSADAVQTAVEQAAGHGGGAIHIAVNAAATPANDVPSPSLVDFDEEIIRRELETKPLGYFRVIKAVAPYFLAQGYGRVVNIGGQSIYATGSIASTVRNAAVVALTLNIADELASSGVTANVIHPGFTVTNRTPDALNNLAAKTGKSTDEVLAGLSASARGGRLTDVAELGERVVFLASRRGTVLNGEVLTTGAQAGRIRTY